jgi:hypothetical protein
LANRLNVALHYQISWQIDKRYEGIANDDASRVWADASGNPIILQGLLPGPHKVLIELVNANHQPLDKGMVTFVVPEKPAAEKHQ